MTTKTVYQCDFAGWYACTTDAHESPLEPGVFHIPAGCVEAEPPAGPYADGLWPRWVGGVWVMQLIPVKVADVSPVDKLAAFLAANPDVAALINAGNGASQGGV